MEGVMDPFRVDPGPPLAFVVPVVVRHEGAGSVAGQYLAMQPLAIGTGLAMRGGGAVIRLRVLLNEGYVAGELLTKLLERHLGPNFQDHYDVLIRTVQTGKVMRLMGRTTEEPWDGSIPILSIRPDCFSNQSDRGAVTARNRAAMSLASLLVQPGRCADTESGGAAAWALSIRSRPRLAVVARNAELQNLAISFGVLLVLAVTVTVLLVSAHRARELAMLHKQFAAGVSHELRTPLSVISSASENLADGVVEGAEQVRQYGHMIHAHSEQLTAMIENALWFARKDPNGTLETEGIEVEELVSAAAATCGRLLEEAGVALDRDIEPGLPLIRGNRTLLLHGLQNLLTNIALYARGGKWARVQVVRRGSAVQFTVEDRGEGIVPEETERIFEPFYRGRGAKLAKAGGLGLGLTLVRRIVEAHDGCIELRSQRGIGTAVAFTIPISECESGV